jgi:hypothetical protein
MINDDDIRRCICKLDSAVAKEGAELIIAYEEGVYCELVGNKAGYLRAGTEMLRAGIDPLNPGEFVTSVDLNYLIGKRGLLVKRLIRREDIDAKSVFKPTRRKLTWKGRVAVAGCITLVVCLAACTLIGVVEVLIWMTGN